MDTDGAARVLMMLDPEMPMGVKPLVVIVVCDDIQAYVAIDRLYFQHMTLMDIDALFTHVRADLVNLIPKASA